jgi:hypothetical protein
MAAKYAVLVNSPTTTVLAAESVLFVIATVKLLDMTLAASVILVGKTA